MTRNRPSTAMSKALAAVTAMLIVTLVLASSAAASEFKILHVFKGADGANPLGGLIFDAAGNLYGTTAGGGSSSTECTSPGLNGCGIVFKLAPNPDGTWTESVLHTFSGADGDGIAPEAGLIFDAAGNLYGTTYLGGDCSLSAIGCGIVFKLAPNSDGTWTESVLHTFNVDGDGAPGGGLIFDAAGNLYGAAAGNGGIGTATVFKLTANSDGTWTESVLFKFFGGYPEAGLIFDAAGNLYGTTIQPGLQGTVFELSPTSDGGWTESTLFTFGGRDGANPLGGLIFDAAGNLYGTTAGGGSSSTECTSGGHNGCGVVFKLAPNPDGTWTESVLHTFLGEPSEYPSAGLTMDAAGNLYGTTNGGGTNYGSVFKLTPTSSGWSYTVLHRFLGLPGEYPYAGVIMDAAGNLYGTTSEGSTNYGLVFEITPCGF